MKAPTLGVLLAAMSALAAESPPVVDEFRLSGGGLVCIKAAGSTTNGYEPCLRIGKARVNGTYSEIVQKFGEPDASEPVDEGRGQARIYLFDREPKTLTYISVWETKGKIIAVQMTGTKADMPKFAGVELGDDAKTLKAKLGPPSKVTPAAGYELWSYRPFPFSIEVRDGRVYSIKVWGAGVSGPCACGKPGCCSSAAPASP